MNWDATTSSGTRHSAGCGATHDALPSSPWAGPQLSLDPTCGLRWRGTAGRGKAERQGSVASSAAQRACLDLAAVPSQAPTATTQCGSAFSFLTLHVCSHERMKRACCVAIHLLTHVQVGLVSGGYSFYKAQNIGIGALSIIECTTVVIVRA